MNVKKKYANNIIYITAMLALGIWILNGVIRYIETEKEAQQMVA